MNMINILIGIVSFFVVSFYSLQFQAADNTIIPMNGFQGKKVLLVNIATGSNHAGQIAGLQQLQQQYADSLVVVAFPSNSFGAESRNNTEILQFCQSIYHTTFRIASKSAVAGPNMHPVYQWLSQQTENGTIDLSVGGDFQKVLISSAGEIIGVFSPKIDPMHLTITNAITGQN